MLRQDGARQTQEDLGDRGWRPPAVLVEAVEHRKGAERGDHVLRLLERAAWAQGVGGGEMLGDPARGVSAARVIEPKVPKEGRVLSPRRAGPLEVVAEVVLSVVVKGGGEGPQQGFAGAKAGVDREPGDACPAGDGQALVEALLDQAPASGVRSGTWEHEQTVADLARELLKLSDSQLQSLHSLATAASEPAVAALLSRLAAGRKRR